MQFPFPSDAEVHETINHIKKKYGYSLEESFVRSQAKELDGDIRDVASLVDQCADVHMEINGLEASGSDKTNRSEASEQYMTDS